MDLLLQLLQEHGWKGLGVVFTAAIAGYGWYISRQEWRKRQALNRFSLSLNTFERDPVTGKWHLWLYAGIEASVDALIGGNSYAKRLLIRAAKATTEEEPFIIPSKILSNEDLAMILNDIANCLECRTFKGALHADAGLPHHEETYLIGLTCEKRRDIRLRKIRALIIRKDKLQDSFFPYLKPEELVLEKPHHRVRWETLQRMRRHYLNQILSSVKILTEVVVILDKVGPAEPAQLLGQIKKEEVNDVQVVVGSDVGDPV